MHEGIPRVSILQSKFVDDMSVSQYYSNSLQMTDNGKDFICFIIAHVFIENNIWQENAIQVLYNVMLLYQLVSVRHFDLYINTVTHSVAIW